MKSQHLLMGRLYEAEGLQQSETALSATIRLNKEDEVFRGHFPDHPVLPGVCTMQIIKELLSVTLAKELWLDKAPNIKYLAFIDPLENETVQLEMQYAYREGTKLSCNARIYSGTTTFCSFKGEFVIRERHSDESG